MLAAMIVRPLLRVLLLASVGVALLAALGCRELVVLAVEPAEVPAGTASEVSFQGRGFGDGLSLRLVSRGLEVGLAPVVVESEERASGRVPAAAPAGRYDVIAELDGLSATLADGLRLVSGEARVTFIDVGQGDATLVVAPTGETLLIDGGAQSAAPKVRAALERESGGRLDAVVLSHFDADHLAGLVEVLAGEDREPGTFDDLRPEIALGPADDGSCATATCDRMRSLGVWPFEVATPGRAFALGDVEVEVVAAEGDVGAGALPGVDDENERSVVVRVRFGGRTLLVLGDLTGGGDGTADVETPLAERTGPVDVLRVAHHGSRTSSATSALSRWAPLASVFSFGTDNAYCHPHPEVLARVASFSGAVYATGRGVVQSTDRCEGATTVPEGGRLGLGDILLRMSADGSMVLADDAL